MKRIKHILFLAIAFASLPGKAAIERFWESRHGAVINSSLYYGLSDPWHTSLVAAGGSLPALFTLNKSEVGIRLHYDEALKKHYSSAWSIQVTCHVEIWDQNDWTPGTVLPTEVFTINYDPTTQYTDMVFKKYSGNFIRVRVTGVSKTGAMASATIPDDVFLDLFCETDRTYKLNTATSPKVKGAYTAVDNTFKFDWTFAKGAEWYELEYLFLDYGTLAFTSNLPIDFANATRVTVPAQTYTINMVYPKGRLLWRVRGVGYSTTTAGEKVYTPWSYDPTAGTTTPPADVSILSTNYDQYYDYNGFQANLNWEYTATFAEDGKRTDNVSFMDGLMRHRQSCTMNQEETRPIVSQTIYDFVGRPAVQVLPSPIRYDNDSGINYYHNLSRTRYTVSSVQYTEDYSYLYFDTDTKTALPHTIHNSTSTGAGWHYSTSNTGDPAHNASYIPDAEGYPFVRTQYLNDGTDRVKSQSGVGEEHQPNSTREVKIYYGSPTQQELDRLFGNEVGLAYMYSKELVCDANGQMSVKYIDNEGRVIATALAGDAPGNLHNIDSRPTSFPTIVSKLHDYNQFTSDNEWIINHSFIVEKDGTYNFSYTMNGDTVCNSCVEYTIAGDPPLHVPCTDCKYDLEIKIISEETESAVSSYSYTDINDRSTVTFSPSLTVGKYTVFKRLKMHNLFVESNLANYLANQDCIDLTIPDGGSCAPGCTTLCQQAHSYINPVNGNTIWFHYGTDNAIVVDAEQLPNGTFVSGNQTAVDNLVNSCVSTCNADVSPSDGTPCDNELAILKIDMSPGGQYFDNLPDFYDGGSYNINNWLEDGTPDNIPIATFLAGISPSCPTCTTWADVRENWNTAWADFTVIYHPEYCAWEKRCEGCSGQPSVDLEDINTHYTTFLASTTCFYSGCSGSTINTGAKIFNPTGIALYATSAGATNSNHTYQPFTQTALTDAQFDPNFICLDTAYNGKMNRMLLRFLPIGGGKYHSIWYVLRDPDGIAASNGSAFVSSTVDAFYDQVHGDGGSIAGILGTGTDQISEIEFFRRAYLLFRDKILYDKVEADCDHLTTATADGFDIRYEEIDIFKDWPTSPMYGASFSSVATTYMDADGNLCEEHADTWVAAVDASTHADCNLSGAQLTALEGHLIDICNSANLSTIDYTYTTMSSGSITVNSVACSTFVQVISSYGCDPGEYTAPVVPVQYNQAECACEAYENFLTAQGLTTSSSTTTIQTALSDYDMLAAGESPTTTQIGVWNTQCSGTPSYATLTSNGLIDAFECPANTNNTQTESVWETDCNNALDELAEHNATLEYNALVEALGEKYEAQIYKSCLDTGATKLNERFTMSYTLSEYHYTLYFYDQAGNLIKTVSPEGVIRIAGGTQTFSSIITTSTNPSLADVAAHRADPVGEPFIHPDHHLKTNYKYNSLNQLIERTTADEGTTHYWYDYLGRLVASQNEKQEASDQYSVVVYDDLSREIEAYVITNTTALTQTIASKTGTASGSWENWKTLLTAGTKIEHTVITYDIETNTTITGWFGSAGQENLRNRIASVTFTQTDGSPKGTYYDYGTHYSYDIHGNVKTVIQDYGELERFDQNLKRIDYEYELVSGNVTQLKYQAGKFDQFFHKYFYDKNNQLEEVYTSKDSILWERDADYFYQTTGQLARHEQGSRAVNGQDYVYTIQGWIKGVNSNTLYASRDVGKDGYFSGSGAQKTNQHYGLDVMGYTLGYYQGDYQSINTAITGTAHFEASTATFDMFDATKPKSNLYNGNIGHVVMAQTTTNNTSATKRILGKAYEYDQLNRLKEVLTNTGIDAANNTWGSSYTPVANFKETGFTYDGNGNILGFQRWGNTNSTVDMDNFTYNYNIHSGHLTNNRLHYVDDAVTQCNYMTDVDDQASGNYGYNDIGQLIKDDAEFITDIFWYHRGKVKKVIKDQAVNTVCSTQVAMNDVEYLYDALGHKVCKIEKPHDEAGGDLLNQSHYIYTWYVNDAMGNVLSTYSQTFAPNGSHYRSYYEQKEVTINGLGREGQYKPDDRELIWSLTKSSGVFFENVTTEVLASTSNYVEELFDWDLPITITLITGDEEFDYNDYISERKTNYKFFELTNHLGSVAVVTTDRKRSYDDGSPDGVVDRYIPEISVWTDTYAFGATAEEGVLLSDYRFSYQGSEKESELYASVYSTEYRFLDSRLGRWFSTDPITHPYQSPYCSMDNNPIALNDVLGLSADGGQATTTGGGEESGPPSLPESGVKYPTGENNNENKGKFRNFATKALDFLKTAATNAHEAKGGGMMKASQMLYEVSGRPKPKELRFIWKLARINPVWWGEKGKGRMLNWIECHELFGSPWKTEVQKKPIIEKVTEYDVRDRSPVIIAFGGIGDGINANNRGNRGIRFPGRRRPKSRTTNQIWNQPQITIFGDSNFDTVNDQVTLWDDYGNVLWQGNMPIGGNGTMINPIAQFPLNLNWGSRITVTVDNPGIPGRGPGAFGVMVVISEPTYKDVRKRTRYKVHLFNRKIE